MESNYKRLGNYIKEVDVRNKDCSLGSDDLFGLSVNKIFIETHANLVGVKFDGYKVVPPGYFTYISDTSRRGDKIAIALNNFNKNIIVSSVYTVFKVSNENLIPEYLELLFRNPEFDRYARYNSWGSAREVFSWDDFCDSILYIPSLEQQRTIIKRYKTIESQLTNSEKIKDCVEQELTALFESEFSPLSEDLGGDYHLSDYMRFGNGYAFKSDDYLDKGKYKIITIKNVGDGIVDTSDVNYLDEIDKKIENNFLLHIGDILVSLTGNVGRTAIVTEENLLLNQRVAKIIPLNPSFTEFLYCLFRHADTKRFLENISTGTAQLNLSPVEVLEKSVPYSKDTIGSFHRKAEPLMKHFLVLTKKINCLKELKTLFLLGIGEK